VGEQIADGRQALITVRQLEVGRVVRDRRVEVDLALFGELCDHSRCDALRAGRPAEHRLRSHRIARTRKSLAIAFEEGDAAILDDSDRHADHRRLLHQLLEPRVEKPVIDIAPGCGRDGSELEMGGGQFGVVPIGRVGPHGQK
jgi:hypothetical protein